MQRHVRASYKNQGFTLIELTIVLVIVGIFIAAVATLAKPYFIHKQKERTSHAIRTIEQGLANYLDRNGAYPCPAPLNSSRGTPEDGTAWCDLSDPGLGSGLIIETQGRPDINSSGITIAGSARTVLIGAIPYRALNIPVDSTIDAYGNRFTYAVSLPSTDPNTYNDSFEDPDGLAPDSEAFHSGAIDIVDTSKSTLLSTAGLAHFFFFSHGRDGKGAYSNAGKEVGGSSCDSQNGRDFENCNGDAKFIADLQSHGLGEDYFDDVSTYSLIAEAEENPIDFLWRRSSSDPSHITNTNSGNVGVNTDEPQAKLDVRGGLNVNAEAPSERIVLNVEGSSVAETERSIVFRVEGGSASDTKEIVFNAPGEGISHQSSIHLFKHPNGGSTSFIVIGQGRFSQNLTVERNLLVGQEANIRGTIKIGSSSAVCDASNAGSMRYNSTPKIIEYCDGSSWKPMGGASGAVPACSPGETIIYNSNRQPECANPSPFTDIKLFSRNLCSSSPPNNLEVSCGSGYKILSCAGGVGPMGGTDEGWEIKPDLVSNKCTLFTSKASCSGTQMHRWIHAICYR